MAKEKIVAVGLLTEHDVRVLGQGFDRLFPIEDLSGFEDLLAKLDDVEATREAETGTNGLGDKPKRGG